MLLINVFSSTPARLSVVPSSSASTGQLTDSQMKPTKVGGDDEDVEGGGDDDGMKAKFVFFMFRFAVNKVPNSTWLVTV